MTAKVRYGGFWNRGIEKLPQVLLTYIKVAEDKSTHERWHLWPLSQVNKDGFSNARPQETGGQSAAKRESTSSSCLDLSPWTPSLLCSHT